MTLTANKKPEGESCGTCRFAGTHTVAEHGSDKGIVRCRRFPPVPRAHPGDCPALAARLAYTHWPYTEWDDWCGEWVERDPYPADETAPVGFMVAGGGEQ